MSAKEAYDYASSVKDPYDTPVYNASSPDADRCHLGVAWYWTTVPAGFEQVATLLEEARSRVPPETAHALIGFVDLEPRANWGHRCRYVFVNPGNGALREQEARFPPFRNEPPPSLRLVWKGEEAPAWTLLTDRSIEG